MGAQESCRKCGAEVRDYLCGLDLPLCFACVTKRSGRSSRLRRLMSIDIVDVGPGGSCIFCRQSFEKNRLGIFLSDGKICEGCSQEIRKYAQKTFAQIIEALPSEWLVKSSGRIFGPFSQKEVEDRLLDRVIVPLDEVCRPFERWKYIRDEVVFSKTVETLRIRGIGVKEDTSTNTLSERGTITTDSTIPSDERLEGSITPVDVTESQPRIEKVESEVKSFGYSEDKNIERRMNPSARMNWMFPLVALIVVLCAWYYLVNKNRGGNFEETYRLGLMSKDQGDHVQALNYFKKANTLKPDDLETRLQLAPLLIVYEQEFVKAARLLEGVGDSSRGEEYRAEAYDLLGLSAMYQDQLSKAAEYFDMALVANREYAPGLINKSILRIKEKRYSDAMEILAKVDVRGPYRGMRAILQAMALVHEGSYKAAQDVIRKYLVSNDEFRQEAMFVSLYAQAKSKPEDLPIYEILDHDPDLSLQFVPDLLTYRAAVDWNALFPWCKEIYDTIEKSTETTALFGYCNLKTNRFDEAKRFLEVALLRDPNDSLVESLRGYYLLTRGKDQEAKEEISLAIKNQPNYRLPYMLKARYCYQSGEFQCSKEIWETLSKKHNNDTSILAGLATSHWRLGNKKEARYWLEKGLQRARNHRPLLKLSGEVFGNQSR